MTPTITHALKLGQIVRYAAPAANGEHHFARGRVVAREQFDDEAASREWWYVRWYDANGKPDGEPMKHARAELEEAP